MTLVPASAKPPSTSRSKSKSSANKSRTSSKGDEGSDPSSPVFAYCACDDVVLKSVCPCHFIRSGPMPRPDRTTVPGLPHHITHRGNRREQIFKDDEDYRTYLRLLRKAIERYYVRLWSYSLMPNHIHLVAVPDRKESLG